MTEHITMSKFKQAARKICGVVRMSTAALFIFDGVYLDVRLLKDMASLLQDAPTTINPHLAFPIAIAATACVGWGLTLAGSAARVLKRSPQGHTLG
jgi:hypothetical protein